MPESLRRRQGFVAGAILHDKMSHFSFLSRFIFAVKNYIYNFREYIERLKIERLFSIRSLSEINISEQISHAIRADR